MNCKEFFKLRELCFLKLLPYLYNKSNSDLYKGGLLKFSLRIDLHNKKPQPNSKFYSYFNVVYFYLNLTWFKLNLAVKPQEKLPYVDTDPVKPTDGAKPEKPKVKMISVEQGKQYIEFKIINNYFFLQNNFWNWKKINRYFYSNI